MWSASTPRLACARRSNKLERPGHRLRKISHLSLGSGLGRRLSSRSCDSHCCGVKMEKCNIASTTAVLLASGLVVIQFMNSASSATDTIQVAPANTKRLDRPVNADGATDFANALLRIERQQHQTNERIEALELRLRDSLRTAVEQADASEEQPKSTTPVAPGPSPVDRFEEEYVDTAWAPLVEAKISRMVEERTPAIRLDAVFCKQTSCRLEVMHPDDRDSREELNRLAIGMNDFRRKQVLKRRSADGETHTILLLSDPR